MKDILNKLGITEQTIDELKRKYYSLDAPPVNQDLFTYSLIVSSGEIENALYLLLEESFIEEKGIHYINFINHYGLSSAKNILLNSELHSETYDVFDKVFTTCINYLDQDVLKQLFYHYYSFFIYNDGDIICGCHKLNHCSHKLVIYNEDIKIPDATISSYDADVTIHGNLNFFQGNDVSGLIINGNLTVDGHIDADGFIFVSGIIKCKSMHVKKDIAAKKIEDSDVIYLDRSDEKGAKLVCHALITKLLLKRKKSIIAVKKKEILYEKDEFSYSQSDLNYLKDKLKDKMFANIKIGDVVNFTKRLFYVVNKSIIWK